MRKKTNIKLLVCIVGSITFVTHCLYYMIPSKTDYMILHLDEKKQRKEWLIYMEDLIKMYRICLWNKTRC